MIIEQWLFLAYAVIGPGGVVIEVEVVITNGLPFMDIVGLITRRWQVSVPNGI